MWSDCYGCCDCCTALSSPNAVFRLDSTSLLVPMQKKVQNLFYLLHSDCVRCSTHAHALFRFARNSSSISFSCIQRTTTTKTKGTRQQHGHRVQHKRTYSRIIVSKTQHTIIGCHITSLWRHTFFVTFDRPIKQKQANVRMDQTKRVQHTQSHSKKETKSETECVACEFFVMNFRTQLTWFFLLVSLQSLFTFKFMLIVVDILYRRSLVLFWYIFETFRMIWCAFQSNVIKLYAKLNQSKRPNHNRGCIYEQEEKV